jgi:hypothetical protein
VISIERLEIIKLTPIFMLLSLSHKLSWNSCRGPS